MIRRYGLVARELVALEPGPSWSELYPVLKQMELCGELARGIFVQGLGAAQFAPSESVDQLRALRDAPPSPPMLINSCDPAFIAPAIGLLLPGPRTLARRPSTYAVLQDGKVVLMAGNAGARIHLNLKAPPEAQRQWLTCLGELLKRGFRAVAVERVNGRPALRSPLRPLLEELGHRAEGKALERRRFG
jgi:ATP-dependent Lhr-like helicase